MRVIRQDSSFYNGVTTHTVGANQILLVGGPAEPVHVLAVRAYKSSATRLGWDVDVRHYSRWGIPRPDERGRHAIQHLRH